MASLPFPDTGTRLVILRSGKPAENATRGYLYADENLTIPAEVYHDDNGVKGALIPADDEGRVFIRLNTRGEQVDYWGPVDGTDRLWIVVNGVASKVDADYNARLDSLGVRVSAVEAGGTGDALVLHRAGAETKTGVLTFTSSPVIPTPSGSTDAANKGYVDTAVTGEASTRASAVTAAIATASVDATTKANAAQAAAVASAATELDTKVDKDAKVVSITDAPFNADRTGAANANAAIAAAHAAVGPTGTVNYPAGTYKTTATTVMECNVTASADAIISYTGPDVAVQVGTDVSGTLIARKRIRLPRIVNAAKTVNGWAQTNVVGTTGVKVINAVRMTIDVPHISNFETGLLVYGKGQGTAYVTFNIGSLDNNKVNQKLDADSTGWSNQNTFVGGSWSHGSNEGANVSGTRHIQLIDTTGNAEPNTNTWLAPSLESPGVVEYTLDVNGSYNVWINPRFEYTGGHAKILWGARAFRNWIWGGNDLDAVIETFTAGGFGNSWFGSGRAHINPTDAVGWIFENGGSSSYAALTLMRAGASGLGDDPLTAYAARFQSNAWKGKRATDAFDRVILDITSGIVQIGDGTAAPTVQWSQGTNSPEGVVTAGIGALYSQNNGAAGTTLWVKESGTGNTGWSPMRPTRPRVTTTASSSTPTPNVANIDIYDLSALAVGATFGAPTGSPVDGQSLLIRIKDNGTSHSLAWNAIYRAVGTSLPTATVASSQLYVGCRYNSAATKWDVLAVGVEA